jgi:7,8-dihydropterin-6-yl-methyl-4-(beta-D-ribofuranosyl)aminobenzene 5'-phosphate synthase
MPFVFLRREGKIEHDNILDDLALVANVRNKGLVIISGCAHAGIVNTVLHAQRMTGIDTIFAVLGGFHLTGPFSEPITDKTIQGLKKIDPKMVIPMHCTSWKATCKIAKEMSSQFMLNSVGTTFSFGQLV